MSEEQHGWWPHLKQEQTSDRIVNGLGGTRHKEYDAAPYVEVVRARIPVELWSGVFFSWLSLKGHLQGFHGMRTTNLYASRIEEYVYAEFSTLWDIGEDLAVWMEEGYPVEEMLRKVGIAPEEIHVQLARQFS